MSRNSSHQVKEFDHLAKLVYLWKHHKPLVKRNSSQTQIFKVIFPTNSKSVETSTSNISTPQASRTLNGTARPQNVLAALEKKSIRSNLSAELGLKALFECKTEQEIDALIIRNSNAPSSEENELGNYNSAYLEHVEVNNRSEFQDILSTGEKLARENILKIICEGNKGVLHWDIEPWSGATLVVRSIANSQEIQNNFNSIWFIRPSSISAPFEKELRDFAKLININASRGNLPEKILNSLKENKILLVVCDAYYMPPAGQTFARDNLMSRLITLANQNVFPEHPTQIFTIGSYVGADRNDDLYNARIEIKKFVSTHKRFDFYCHLFEIYRLNRGHKRYEDGGSRLKRGKWHYDYIRQSNHRIIWPSMVRMRAYFASNMTNYAYFDPTLGFEYLAGSNQDLPLCIQIARDDLISYVRHTTSANKKIRALRYSSIGKHWLTESVLSLLVKGYRPDDNGNPLLQYASSADSPISIHREKNQENHKKDGMFSLDLGIKSIIHDTWKIDAPLNRANCHWKLAKYLWDEQNNKDILRAEFPYIPNWGRSRLYMLGECLRHLICTLDSYDLSAHPVSYIPGDFPDIPTSTMNGCSPHQVINFCFIQIYQKELNGNNTSNTKKSIGNTGRALSKRHGAFQYAAELLQLMGKNRTIGEPHPHLIPVLREVYQRECAFSLLDLGELTKSEEILRDVIHGMSATHSEKLCMTMLDLSLILTEKASVDEAECVVNDVEKIIKKYSPPYKEKILRRALSRKFSIEYQKRDYLAALEIAGDMDVEVSNLGPELIQTWIKAKIFCDPLCEAALKECMKALFKSITQGFQHESLAYRLLLSRIFRFRKEYKVAEQVLDDVLRDVLKYGCSERTYLELYLEAGMILSSVGKFARSYASYLRPCMLRSKSRNYVEYNQLAKEQAKIVLQNMISLCEKSSEEELQNATLSAIEEEEVHSRREGSGSHSIEIDPLYSFYVHNSISILKKLSTIDGIESEIKLVASH